jgi:hypothetical protein
VAGGQQGYREHSRFGRRVPRGTLRYNEFEWAVIAQVAAIADQKPGAWAQQAAYEAALRANQGEPTTREAVVELAEELRQHRRVLTNIGGNLNDLARVANSTGEIQLVAAAQTVMRLIGNVVRASDTLVVAIRKRLLP